MTTSSGESGVFLRSLSHIDAIVGFSRTRTTVRTVTAAHKESSMAFVMTLLLSLVIGDWLFCGELQRLSDTVVHTGRRRYAQVALRLTTEDRQSIGSGCRWE